jgi:hypothetical protein
VRESLRDVVQESKRLSSSAGELAGLVEMV